METDSNQDKILYQIKRLGPLTVKSLAEKLGVTTMAIRQHLGQLEDEGLVASEAPIAQKRGRPVKSWKLTAAGHRRFPDAHAQVTTEIIASVSDLLGKEALDKVIQHRADHAYELYTAELSKCRGLADKVSKLAKLRTDEGYMAEVEKLSRSEFRLIENHCPICIAATSCQGFCRSELDTFRKLFGDEVSVTREDYLLEGARRCSYLISSDRQAASN